MKPYNIEAAIWKSSLDTKEEVWYHEDDVAEMYIAMRDRIKELEKELEEQK